VPLERLIEGTRRAANKDFGVRVDVANNDEFGELARSFNTMAARLGRQFTALSTLADIDRAILSRPEVERVIEAVLWRISAIVPVQHAGIVIADRHRRNDACLYAPWRRRRRRLRASPARRQRPRTRRADARADRPGDRGRPSGRQLF
jgi:nitrogen fixation/metabolism regulation signal transduction histidine kinase